MIARWALSVFDMCLLTQSISLIGFAIFAVFVDNPSSWWAFVARHTDALTWAWVVLSSLAVAARMGAHRTILTHLSQRYRELHDEQREDDGQEQPQPARSRRRPERRRRRMSQTGQNQQRG